MELLCKLRENWPLFCSEFSKSCSLLKRMSLKATHPYYFKIPPSALTDVVFMVVLQEVQWLFIMSECADIRIHEVLLLLFLLYYRWHYVC